MAAQPASRHSVLCHEPTGSGVLTPEDHSELDHSGEEQHEDREYKRELDQRLTVLS